jgi:hypothetical protein
MSVEPTHEFGLLIAALRTMVAKSDVWQAWTEADDEAEALALVNYGLTFTPRALATEALVGQINGDGNKVSGGDSDVFDLTADVLLAFTADVPETYLGRALVSDAYVDFMNKWEGVRDEVLALCGTAGHPICNGWELMKPPVRVFQEDAEYVEREGEDENTDYHEVALVFHFGVS